MSANLLGVQPTVDGLKIVPCLPERYNDMKIQRKYRDATYNVHVTCGTQKGMAVNGKVVPGNVIPVQEPGAACEVELTI
jgi:cellobiose phosphorylase